jgi:hypothetical protein
MAIIEGFGIDCEGRTLARFETRSILRHVAHIDKPTRDRVLSEIIACLSNVVEEDIPLESILG